MKAMHNLRLVASDIFTDICQFPEDLEVALPQRLQTSMALYSNNLSGLVLLTDDAKVCVLGCFNFFKISGPNTLQFTPCITRGIIQFLILIPRIFLAPLLHSHQPFFY